MMECEEESMLNIPFHQQVLLCVCMHNCLQICNHLELWILFFRDNVNNYMIFFWQLPFLKFVQGNLFAFLDGLLSVSFTVPLARASSLPFPSPFEFRCGDPDGEGERGRPFPLPFLFGSCLNAHASPNEHWSFLIQRLQSLLSDLFLTFKMSFPFAFPLFGAPIRGLSSSRFLVVKKESSIFCSRCHWTINFDLGQSCFLSPCVVSRALMCNKYFNSSDFPICILCRLSNMMWVGLMLVTADKTSSNFVLKTWTLSLFFLNFQ